MKELTQKKRTNSWISGEGEQELVSVIVPTYNRAAHVNHALDSVWNQSYRPVEVIAVDDGSMDSTYETLEVWGMEHSNDPDFRFIPIRQENVGAPAARNRGVLESHGEFIQFLDSDDELYPDRFEKLVLILQNEGCDTVHSGFDRRCGKCGQFLGRYIPPMTDDPLEACLNDNLWINTFDFLDRRSLIARVGPWDESLICAQDLDYSYRRLIHSEKICTLEQALCVCNMAGGDRISKNKLSPDGWHSRLTAEDRFCSALNNGRHVVSSAAKNSYATTLYAVAVKLYASGLTSIATEYKNLGARMQIEPVPNGLKRMRALCNAGSITCRAWVAARELKRNLKQTIGKERRPHECAG